MARPARRDIDQLLLTALACGATVEHAAAKAGITERTAYRRLANAGFRERLAALRADMVQRTAGLLTGAGMSSVKTLVDLQHDAAVAAGVRRRAARDVLEMGLRFRENVELEQRLLAVEEQLSTARQEIPVHAPGM